MNSRFEFRLTPAYCLYNGAAVLEQDGACIRFLIENEEDSLLKERLTRAFQTHLERILKMKECPESFRRLPSIEFIAGNRNQLRKCVSKLYRAEEGASTEAVVTEDARNRREAAAVLLLDSILNEARSRKATDIHIEHNCVRLRVAGRLEKLMELKEEKSAELVQRIKLLSGMNVIEKRRCQDGQFIYGNKNPFFLRVSTMAVVGEKYVGEESVVLRLLDTSRLPLSLDGLGFNAVQLEKLAGEDGLCRAGNGLVLVCGPTGSGKSTTVASLLVELGRSAPDALKIISLEDPPEYVIPGVTQVKVDERNSFSDALNHIFRQDPDVIMIGEIRDEESAAAAMRASLTGHLVFATLHSGSLAEAILRLENLGVARRQLCETLRALICQELNYIDGGLQLYADIALPVKGFAELVSDEREGWLSEEKLDSVTEHFTNYHEVFKRTLNVLADGKPVRRLPYLKGRKNAERIHKGLV